MNNVAISSVYHRTVSSHSVSKIKTLDESMNESVADLNLGFLMMYEEWKQNILLSDGINEVENSEW